MSNYSNPTALELITFGLPHALRNDNVVAFAGQIDKKNQYHYILGDYGQDVGGYLTFDCNGFIECFTNLMQPDIEHNTKARYNYAQWCPPTMRGVITPTSKLVPGVGVFAGDTEAGIHHVGVLCCKFGPGPYDWLVLQSECPSLGFRLTRLFVDANDFHYFGYMTKYITYNLDASFDPLHHPEQLRFPACPYPTPAVMPVQGAKNDLARWVQWHLIMHNYLIDNSGPHRNGIDGDFGPLTQKELRRFSDDHGGLAGAALLQALGTHIPAVK